MSFSFKIFLTGIFYLVPLICGHSKVLYVGVNREYDNIQKAINSAEDSDTIIIENGIYKETNIILDRKLTLTGRNFPVIDGENRNEEILTVTSDSCIIEGLVFKNTGYNFLKDIACIRTDKINYTIIRKNIFENSFFAIYFSNSGNCKADSNLITGNSTSESFSGNGIHLWYCDNATISNNAVSGQRDGIYLEFSKNCKILNNSSYNNLRYGLHFMFSEGNSYIANKFSHNGAGVAVMYTKHVLMADNFFENNWGPNSYGLLLKDIDESKIINNYFTGNTTGIYAEGSNRTLLKNNTLHGNGWGIKILGNCYDDTLTNNNFINNTFDISTNSSQNTNFYSNNYWDEYRGYDLNKDGTGDVPYRPVSIFSTIVERNPESILLLRSFLVDLLDLTEKVLPSFIPETLIDESPQMNVIENDKHK